MGAINIAKRATYEKMSSQASYYLDSLDSEIMHIRKLQNDFFSDRKLAFLVSPIIPLSDYEKREALLSVRERTSSIEGISSIIDSVVLYITQSSYKIMPGSVRRISDDDISNMISYLEYNKQTINYNNNEIYMISTGMPNIVTSDMPDYLFCIFLDKNEIEKNLSVLNRDNESGVFLYNNKSSLFVESSSCGDIGREIYENLKYNSDGTILDTQSIVVDNEKYMVFVAESDIFGLFVQYSKLTPIMNKINMYRNYLYAFIVVAVGLFIVFTKYTEKIIHRPLKILLKAFSTVKSGQFDVHIETDSEAEFRYIFEGFNEMEDQINILINEVYAQKALIQRAELKQLQAQINPHFLYNSFFALSRRVKRHDYESAQEFANHLGNYFRFLTRNSTDYINLKQEVEHAKSYAAIQGVRFVSRLKIEFQELPQTFEAVQVPRLILQPILENVFEHGLENKEENGLVRIIFENERDVYKIIVEDNGEDTTDQDIDNMRESLTSETEGEVTGIINIHKRLNNYYREIGGLLIERSELGGVKIGICIGKGKETTNE